MFDALLVDDDELVLRMLATVLSSEGFNVATATSAAQATEMLHRDPAFDIVVTDLKMETPAAGFDVVGAAKRMVPRPVIVILTAFPVPPSTWKDAGADALFVKGENPLALPKQLRGLMENPTP